MARALLTFIFSAVCALSTNAQSLTVSESGGDRGVVVRTSDGMVVGRTDRGSLDDAMRSEPFLELLHCMERTERLKTYGPHRAPARTTYRSGATSTARRLVDATRRQQFKTSVAPLLRNLWSQYDAPYDMLTPKIDGQSTDAGCVALAMAQVMHYWQWPEHGYGSYTYYDEKGCEDTLTANFSQHYYDWGNMLGNYANVQYTEAQGAAVAQLLLDCGIAVDMRYGVAASGARVVRQPQAMVSHFGYDSSCQLHYRDFYTIDQWTDMFKEELSAGRPILVSGLSNKYNHAFVCDGYDENDFFHFSLGNVNGAADGFFYLPYLTPDIPPESVPEEAEGGFNVLQSMTSRIMPVNRPDATGVETHLYGLSGMGTIGADTCVVIRLGNMGWNEHNDSVALALVTGDEIVGLPYVYDRHFLLEEVDDTTYTDTIRIEVDEKVECGTYRLMPMFRDNGEWKEALTTIGTPNYLIANVTNGIGRSKDGAEKIITLHADTASTACVTLHSYSFPDWIKPNSTPDYSISLTCRNADYCGRVYVVLENVDEAEPSYMIQRQGVNLGAETTTTHRFYHTPAYVKAGQYRLRIYCDNDLFSGEAWLFDEIDQIVTVADQRPTAIDSTSTENETAHDAVYRTDGTLTHRTANDSHIYIKGGKKWLKR